MAIEGRWTIWVNEHGNRVLDDDAQVAVRVPVVPCDDAAVDRATLALYERLNPPGSPRAIFGITWYRETAEAVLRAAGGQDAS
jgi:hypothetical protein